MVHAGLINILPTDFPSWEAYQQGTPIDPYPVDVNPRPTQSPGTPTSGNLEPVIHPRLSMPAGGRSSEGMEGYLHPFFSNLIGFVDASLTSELFAAALLAHAGGAHAQTLALHPRRPPHGMRHRRRRRRLEWRGRPRQSFSSGSRDLPSVAVAILGDADSLTIRVFPAEPEALNALKAGAIHLCGGHLAFGNGGDTIRRWIRTPYLL